MSNPKRSRTHNSNYVKSDSIYENWTQRRLKRMADLCCHGLILDIGFASHPNIFLKGKVIGIDVKSCNTPSNYWTTLIASGEALPFINQVDAICAGEIIEHLQAPITFLAECNKALKHGGKFILSTPNPYHLIELLKNILGERKSLYADDHLNFFPPRLVNKLLDLSGFRVLRCYGNYFKIPGMPLRIPTEKFPYISSNIIYFSHKRESVSLEEISPTLVRKFRNFYDDYEHRHGKLPRWRR